MIEQSQLHPVSEENEVYTMNVEPYALWTKESIETKLRAYGMTFDPISKCWRKGAIFLPPNITFYPKSLYITLKSYTWDTHTQKQIRVFSGALLTYLLNYKESIV